MGDSRPDGAELEGFSMFFSSISSWWIHRSGGRRSFWLPFLLPALWVARFLCVWRGVGVEGGGWRVEGRERRVDCCEKLLNFCMYVSVSV